MGASIWSPNSPRNQTFIATAAQVDYVITHFTYEPSTGSLTVYKNGVQIQIQYIIETSSSTFSISPDVVISNGDIIYCEAAVSIPGTASFVEVTPAEVGADKYMKVTAGGTAWEGKTISQLAAAVASALAANSIATSKLIASEFNNSNGLLQLTSGGTYPALNGQLIESITEHSGWKSSLSNYHGPIGSGTVTLSTLYLYLIPVVIGRRIKISNLYVNVTTGFAAATCKLSVFRYAKSVPNSNLTLIAETGELDCSSTGVKGSGLSNFLEPGMYFLGLRTNSGSIAVTATAADNSREFFGVGSFTDANKHIGMTCTPGVAYGTTLDGSLLSSISVSSSVPCIKYSVSNLDWT